MKNYTQEIQITVSVSSIANQLLSTIKDDNIHAEKITETIIDHLLPTNNGMSHLYNSLNGYSNDINFAIGQEVECI